MLNKKTVGVVVVCLSTLAAASSHAATQGTYFGGQLGYGNVHQKLSSSSFLGTVKHANKDSGVAGRIFGGYQVNENFAGELGWSKFSDAKVKASVPGATGSATLKTDAVDLVAKGIYPVMNNVNVYGKAGGAYVIQRGDGKITTSNNREISKGSNTEKKLLPTFGVGASYDFNPNLAADVSYNRIQKVGSTKINSTDLVSVGLIYSIG